MKKNTFLLIALVVCILLFASYFIIISIPEKDNVDDDTDGSYIYIDQNDIDNIEGFSFVGGEFDLSFEKADSGKWKYTKNNTLPVNDTFLEKKLEAVEIILATKLISDSANREEALEEYGFATPSYTLTLDVGKSQKVYLFGDFIESKGVYYMTQKDSGTIYLVENSYVNNFSHDVFDFLSTDTPKEIHDAYISSVQVVCGAYEETFTADKVENSDISRLITALCSIELTRCVDFGSNTFDIYGLSDNEAISVYISHSDEVINYKFGLGETEEFIYLLVEKGDGEFSEMVYLFSSSEFEHLYSYLNDAFEGRSNN